MPVYGSTLTGRQKFARRLEGTVERLQKDLNALAQRIGLDAIAGKKTPEAVTTQAKELQMKISVYNDIIREAHAEDRWDSDVW